MFQIQRQFSSYGGGEKLLPWYIFYALSFVLLYYSYATLLQTGEKKISKATLCLMAMTTLSFLILFIAEILKGRLPLTGVFLLLFGLYFFACFTSEKVRLSLRRLAWALFLPMFILVFYVFLAGAPM
ncbi:hypothetical protein [Methanolapillus millepedarum]|uniref:hypothetical protein n=1 Tax=Methanolapillus millepedarum TaxID=3028296 RepID=UPI0030B87A16